ncbi:hypothetical protein H0H81_005495 [Sphagnurus paluster]|uniref:Uncharacterized protein n=1 Tax=Sphagnurus paluster TaxID=117069 RepID=A0A9P7GWP6_9AGAR|nr:hypothetical protein H0H81_005495 [Sphagnurus paluster]
MEVESEVQESTTIVFEWTLKGLKNLFDSTRGESKSKVTKSVRFGGGRWQSHGVKSHDAFVILCTITSSPAPPPPIPSHPRQSVPKGLLDTVGALLNDPLYSDVEFIIPGRAGKLSSEFAEGCTAHLAETAPSLNESDANLVMNELEDSDDEDEDDVDLVHPEDHEIEPISSQDSLPLDPPATSVAENAAGDDDQMEQEGERNVRAKLSHPSSPRSNQVSLPSRPSETSTPPKLTVVVKDVAYSTYLALLYYNQTPGTPVLTASQPSPSETQGNTSTQKRNTYQYSTTSRHEWIEEWKKNNPERPAPCSAKAAYRLADR